MLPTMLSVRLVLLQFGRRRCGSVVVAPESGGSRAGRVVVLGGWGRSGGGLVRTLAELGHLLPEALLRREHRQVVSDLC